MHLNHSNTSSYVFPLHMVVLNGDGIGSGTMGRDVVTTIWNGEFPASPTARMSIANSACMTAAAILILLRLSNPSFAPQGFPQKNIGLGDFLLGGFNFGPKFNRLVLMVLFFEI